MALALALAGTDVARAEEPVAQPAAAVDELPQGQEVSDTVIELAGWVVASKDSQGYPFAVLDKAAAQILIFGGDGKLRGAAPALFGSAIGDHSAPGVAGLALRAIPGRDRTTPAGRFVGGYGPSIDAGRVLWVDYESAVSLHPTPPGTPAEKRAERLASASPDDNRVTHGCINVSMSRSCGPRSSAVACSTSCPTRRASPRPSRRLRRAARLHRTATESVHVPPASDGRIAVLPCARLTVY